MSRRRSALRLPDDGPCGPSEGHAAHPCDECDRCRSGDCCGQDVGEAGLPLEGSWPWPWHGEIGVLAVDPHDGRVQCHICADWYHELGRHVQAHGITGDAYKALFGLKVGTALASESLRMSRAANAPDLASHPIWRDSPVARMTGEQRSAIARRREARAETRRQRDGQPRDSLARWVPARGAPILARRHPTQETAK